jgi:hypothetical protein
MLTSVTKLLRTCNYRSKGEIFGFKDNRLRRIVDACRRLAVAFFTLWIIAGGVRYRQFCNQIENFVVRIARQGPIDAVESLLCAKVIRATIVLGNCPRPPVIRDAARWCALTFFLPAVQSPALVQQSLYRPRAQYRCR